MTDSELLRELRTRVDCIVAPHRELYGDDAPPVRMALRVLAEAEDIDCSLRVKKRPTDEAAELTGWHPETLQHQARRTLAGETVPRRWAGLVVEETPAGYLFELDSIPAHPRHRRVA